MKQIATFAPVLVGAFLIASAGQTAYAGKKKRKVETWNLNVVFVVGVGSYAGSAKRELQQDHERKELV